MMGFTQPCSVLPILKDVTNNAKGFTSRILWYFPEPVFAKLKDTMLEKSEKDLHDQFQFFLGEISHVHLKTIK